MIDNFSVQVYRAVVHLVPNFVICHNNNYTLFVLGLLLCVTIIACTLCIYVVRHQ